MYISNSVDHHVDVFGVLLSTYLVEWGHSVQLEDEFLRAVCEPCLRDSSHQQWVVLLRRVRCMVQQYPRKTGVLHLMCFLCFWRLF